MKEKQENFRLISKECWIVIHFLSFYYRMLPWDRKMCDGDLSGKNFAYRKVNNIRAPVFAYLHQIDLSKLWSFAQPNLLDYKKHLQSSRSIHLNHSGLHRYHFPSLGKWNPLHLSMHPKCWNKCQSTFPEKHFINVLVKWFGVKISVFPNS